jgi:hypothetical protein
MLCASGTGNIGCSAKVPEGKFLILTLLPRTQRVLMEHTTQAALITFLRKFCLHNHIADLDHK